MGNFIEYFKYNSRGKIVLHSTTMHDRQGRDTQYTEFRRNGKFFRGFTFKYDKNGEETDERMFWRKPEHMTWHNTYKYDSSRNMIESISSIKNDKKIISKYTYSYYPDGSKKQTIGYDGKGSITHLWNYECNPEGTINTRKLKDTSKVCVRYETDKDGNKIKIREEMVHEGRIVRKIIKYNKAGYTLETAGYNKKGIALYRNIFSYNGEGRLSESVYYKPKSNEINHKYHYQYDKNGNCIKFVSYKSANPEEAGIIYRIIYM